MDWGNLIAGLVGGGSLIVATAAVRRASEANKKTQAANNIAADALRESRRANDIGQQSYELSKDEQQVLALQASQPPGQRLVRWDVEVDEKALIVSAINTSGDTALDVTIHVSSPKVLDRTERLGDVGEGQSVEVALPEAIEQRIQWTRHVAPHIAAERSEGILRHGGFKLDLQVTVRWHTSLGQPQIEVTHLKIK